jgi:hypothetical protein
MQRGESDREKDERERGGGGGFVVRLNIRREQAGRVLLRQVMW